MCRSKTIILAHCIPFCFYHCLFVAFGGFESMCIALSLRGQTLCKQLPLCQSLLRLYRHNSAFYMQINISMSLFFVATLPPLQLDLTEAAWARVRAARAVVDKIVEEKRVVYGISTGNFYLFCFLFVFYCIFQCLFIDYLQDLAILLRL